MNPLSLLRIEIIKRPIFNLLLLLLALFGGNLWWAVIVLTLLIRWLLWKNSAAATNMQAWMKDMQPKMQEIQEKYKDDPERMSKEMMKLWKDGGSNPLKWCLTMLIQIPVFLWLFYNVKDIAEGKISATAYSFLEWLPVDLSNLDTMFLWIDLLTPGNIILTVLAWVLMYGQMQVMTALRGKQATPNMWALWSMGWALGWGKDAPDMWKMMWMMNYFMVIMMAWFVWTMPSWVGLYIVTTTLFWVLQQLYQQWPLVKVKLQLLTWAKKTTTENWDPIPEIIEP